MDRHKEELALTFIRTARNMEVIKSIHSLAEEQLLSSSNRVAYEDFLAILDYLKSDIENDFEVAKNNFWLEFDKES